MIANLLHRSDLDAQNVDDISKPTVVTLANVISDGITQNWVDLSTYIALLDSSNSQMVLTNDGPRLASNYIPMLKWWFLSAGKSSETTILASMLLNAFLTETTVAELFVALQMDENGALAFDVDPFAAFQAGVVPKTLPSNAIEHSAAELLCQSYNSNWSRVCAWEINGCGNILLRDQAASDATVYSDSCRRMDLDTAILQRRLDSWSSCLPTHRPFQGQNDIPIVSRCYHILQL